MKSSTTFGFSSSLLFFFIVAAFINVVYTEDAASIVVDSETETCSYRLIVRTGDGADAGTDSRISVTFSDSDGKQVDIPDLKELGTMPPGHDYFKNRNEDIFHVDASVCMYGAASVCKITVTSDGSGQMPGWFLEDVDVVTHDISGPGSLQFPGSLGTTINFNFREWLAKDEPPYKLTASVNNCK